MRGEIQTTLRDRATNAIIRRETIRNGITDIWKMRSGILTMSTGTPGVALRGESKPTSGQYVAPLAVANFGIYALRTKTEILPTDIIPPYVDKSHAALSDDVTFYNVNNSGVETDKVLLSADNRSVYSYDPATATYTVKYVKNSGDGRISSVIFGRDFAAPHGHQGFLIGEALPSISTSGTTNYFIEHRIDRSIIWKTISATSQFSYDLLTNQVIPYNSSALNTNIANASLTGGLVIGNTVVKATQQASSATEYTVRLTAAANFTASTATATKDIVFNGAGLVESRLARPVLVARPDRGAFEVFIAMETANDGVVIKKATVTNFGGSIANADVAISTVATLPYLIATSATVTAAHYCTGYYDIEQEQYYLPYSQYVNSDGSLTTVQTENYQPGLVLNASDFSVIKPYYAKTETNVALPVLTNKGILQCRCGTTTMYYFYGSGVISGASYTVPFEKTVGSILEIDYRYTFNIQ